MCLGVFLLGFILLRNLWASWTWLTISFPILVKFSGFSNIFSGLFSLFSWDPYHANVGVFNVIPEDSGCLPLLFLFSPILFSIFFFTTVFSTILSSRSFIHSSASIILLLIHSSVFFISICPLVLLGFGKHFLHCIFFILFSRSWTICTIIILNYFSGMLPISPSFVSYFLLVCLFVLSYSFILGENPLPFHFS